MGTVVKNLDISPNNTFKLTIYVNPTKEQMNSAVSLNYLLAKEIIQRTPERRSIHLETCFLSVIKTLPDYSLVKDIDVLFNPIYQVNIMTILLSAFKKKKFSLIWPGVCDNGKLYYSEPGFKDYESFSIIDYDIICAI